MVDINIDLNPGRNDPALKQAVKLVTACYSGKGTLDNDLNSILSPIINEARRNPEKAGQLLGLLTFDLALFGATAAIRIAELEIAELAARAADCRLNSVTGFSLDKQGCCRHRCRAQERPPLTGLGSLAAQCRHLGHG